MCTLNTTALVVALLVVVILFCSISIVIAVDIYSKLKDIRKELWTDDELLFKKHGINTDSHIATLQNQIKFIDKQSNLIKDFLGIELKTTKATPEVQKFIKKKHK